MQVNCKTYFRKFFWIFGLLLPTACSLSNNSPTVVKTCVLPPDQSKTLEGHWQRTPVPISLDQNSNFSSFETAALTGAADTWNSFFSQSLGMNPLDYGGQSVRVSTTTKPSVICSQTIISTAGYTGSVVVYKDGSWPYSHNAIALTTYCPTTTTSGGLPFFGQAITELNYQDFFVPGKPVPDLQTILTHELGHLVGVNHSCENSTSSTAPNCQAAGIPDSYISAIMFPSFGFDSNGNGIQRRTLSSDDEGRANCLYQGASPVN